MIDKKVALITGCSSGIGFLTALKFARHGYQTWAGLRDPRGEGGAKLQEIKDREGLDLTLLRLDVGDDQSVNEVISEIVSGGAKIDVLVNNAGFGYLGPVEEFTIEEVRQQYETNIFGVLRMVKAVVPSMRSQGSGLVVNVSSIAGKVTLPLYGVYSSSKFALEALSEALRFELAPFGVKVVVVAPGTFETRFNWNRKLASASQLSSSPYRSLMGRFFDRALQKSARSLFGLITRFNQTERVADLIYRIAQERSPRVRYLVGLDAYLYSFFHRVLPSRLWQWLLRRLYRW